MHTVAHVELTPPTPHALLHARLHVALMALDLAWSEARTLPMKQMDALKDLRRCLRRLHTYCQDHLAEGENL